MKALIVTFIAASVLVAFAAPPSAHAGRHKHFKKHVRYHAYLPRYAASSYGYVPRRQIEYDTRTLTLGTGTWWQQYDRERGGRR